MAIADMEVETSTKSKLTRFARIFGTIAALAVSAALVGGCGGDEPCDACCQLRKYQENQGLETDLGLSDIAVGTAGGVACRNRVEAMWDDPTLLYSASKMVTGVLMLKLVDLGLLALDTKVATVLDFWDATDVRKDVNLRHLLSQTSGLRTYPGGLGVCTAATTFECALEAYEVGFTDLSVAPGETFAYTETSFFVMGAMAMNLTGLQTYDDVFQQYLAQPVGIDGSRCGFVDSPEYFPVYTKENSDPGGSLVCHTLEYAKILEAILGKTLFDNSSLHDEAETPHTLNAAGAPAEVIEGAYWHYGLGQWIECSTPQCEGGIVRASSLGYMGTYPWVDRRGSAPHWGLVVRWGDAGGTPQNPIPPAGSEKAVLENVVPLAAEIVRGSSRGESTATSNVKVMQV